MGENFGSKKEFNFNFCLIIELVKEIQHIAFPTIVEFQLQVLVVLILSTHLRYQL